MSEDTKKIAEKEIHNTLRFCNFFIRNVGLSFVDEIPTTYFKKIFVLGYFVAALSLILLILIGEHAYIIYIFHNLVSLEQLIGSNLHIIGYGIISFGKLLTLWYKKNTFRQVVKELADIWPVAETNAKAVAIKNSSLKSLRSIEILYVFLNVIGVSFYTLTPVALHIYRLTRGIPTDLGYVWQLYYPFDQTKPVVHELVYMYEIFAGMACVSCMLGCDVFFITMASHISMLLRILQVKITSIGTPDGDKLVRESLDCYDEIVAVVKIHQRLIRYGNDLEDAFAVVNLINVLLSSVDICCVMFTIVFLDPVMEVSSKFFLGAALTQMGIVCWYADDIFTTSLGVSDAVYESGWYNCDIRSRRALLLMLERSQRPLYFTALKFSPITLNTYRSILTTSYSYFTLLYTAYRQN
ncbi:odorant receptor 4-like [Achroia grisella]|uniref:odorant receptor 4-like n=1 Tax=Achroia grisella TaxID=688607 RepID=UPI0027D229DC|nr:odorant receptor 4-like [Achroia grisella]